MRRLEAAGIDAAAVAAAAVTVVESGGTLVFPTDTVYGIGCDPLRPDAVRRIFALKRRPRSKPLSLHLASTLELLEYAGGNRLAAAAAQAFLPGPLTIVVPRPRFVDEGITAGLASLGLRVPKHPLCLAIIERCGPLAATSANISGEPAFVGAGRASLPAADLLIDDGPTPIGAESTIIDVSGKRARLVREGAIGIAMLEEILGPVERPQP